MKKTLRILLFLILCLFVQTQNLLYAQQYPVRVTPVVLAPYSLKLSDYATTTQQKLQVQILMTDLMQPAHQTGLKFSLEAGLNAQPFARSNDFVVGLPPFNLYPGTPVTLSNIDLRPLFELQNLNGISALQYSKALPEGAYQFCFQAFDFYTKNNLSAKSCATVYLTQYDPPQLNIPQNAEKIQAINPYGNGSGILFQWMPRQVAPNTKYNFILKEIWDTNQSPISAFLASPVLWKEETFAPNLYYSIDKTQLIPGRRYAWQVQAFSSNPFDNFNNFPNHQIQSANYKNNGLSEIFFFDYVENCQTPTFLMAKNKGRGRVEIQWNFLGNPAGLYKIQYRKKGANTPWMHTEAYQNSAFISGLEDLTEYEYRVGAVCGQTQTFSDEQSSDNAYAFSPVQFFTTDSQDLQNNNFQCGVMPAVDISNKEPLRQSLVANDTFTAGDFPVTIIEAQGSNGIFSGTGYIQVPYLADTKIKVAFNNISINSDKKLISGTVETEYDPEERNIMPLGADFLKDDFVKIEDIISKGIDNNGFTSQEYENLDNNTNEITKKIDDEITNLENEGFITKEEAEEYRVLIEEAKESLKESACFIKEEPNTPKNENNIYGKSFLDETNWLLLKNTECSDKPQKFKELLNNIRHKVGEKVETLKVIKQFWEFIKKCGDDYKNQKEGYIPRCIWDHDNYIPKGKPFIPYKYDPALSSGFIDGAIETVVGIVKLAEFSICYDIKNPVVFLSDHCKNIRNQTIETVIDIGRNLSTEDNRKKLFKQIGESFSDYIDETIALTPQARYNQGKLVFDIIGLFYGATEVKGGKIISNIVTKIKNIKNLKKADIQKVKEVFKTGKNIYDIPIKYRVKIFEKLKVIQKDTSLPSSIINTFEDSYYYTAETLENIKVFRRFGGEDINKAKLLGGYTSTEALLNRQELALLRKWNTMQFEAEILIEKGTKLNVGKVAEYGKYSGGADQVILPINYPENWIKKVKDLKTGKEYSLEEFKKIFPKQVRR